MSGNKTNETGIKDPAKFTWEDGDVVWDDDPPVIHNGE